MKNILLPIFLLWLVGCGKTDQSKIPESTQQEVNPESEMSEDQAKEFAINLLSKINEDEKFIKDAYELKEQATLEKYVITDWNKYVQTPFSEIEAKEGFGHLYFPKSEVAAPYIPCDTAFTDLQLYASTMSQHLRDDTATMRKIVRQEEQDYLKSKAQCEARINMTYKQAYEAYEKEYS